MKAWRGRNSRARASSWLTIDGMLNNAQRAEHLDYGPDLNFKKAKAELEANQQTLIERPLKNAI